MDGQQATGAGPALDAAPNISIFKGLKPTFLHSSNLPDYVDVEGKVAIKNPCMHSGSRYREKFNQFFIFKFKTALQYAVH